MGPRFPAAAGRRAATQWQRLLTGPANQAVEGSTTQNSQQAGLQRSATQPTSEASARPPTNVLGQPNLMLEQAGRARLAQLLPPLLRGAGLGGSEK